MRHDLQIAVIFASLTMLSALLPGVSPPASSGTAGQPLANEPVVFENVTRAAGFASDGWTRVAWGDYNGDGWEDLLLNGNTLYRNDKDGTFTDVTAVAGIGGVPSNGGVWADYDNDGDLDFYATVNSFTSRDALWRNNGDGTFTDVTLRSGEIFDYLPTEGAAWGDYDADGYVDLYVANYETYQTQGDPLGVGTPDVLYHNKGDGTFENVSHEAGIELATPLCGRGVVWGDYDDDGDADIYVSNYRLQPNLLWRNNGNGTFTDVAHASGVDGKAIQAVPGSEGRYGHTIGSDFGDYDNDGRLDLYVSNLAHPRYIEFSDLPMLMQSRGDGTFTDRFATAGIAYCETSSDPAWGDFDNDGDLDLYFTAVYEGRWSKLYRNDGRGRFTDVTAATRTAVNNGWGCAWADYDRDGFLDLAVGSGSGFQLLHNKGNSDHWVEVELVGTSCNAAAIGARVKVIAGGTSYIREVQGGRGTTSQNMLACHFGLGAYSGDMEVWVSWPGEAEYKQGGTAKADSRVRVVQPKSVVDASVHLTVDPPAPNAGQPVKLTATVENVGQSDIESAKVRFSVGTGQIGQDLEAGSIPAGESREVETMWQPLQEGSYEVMAEIVQSRPPDGDRSNDAATVTVQVSGANEAPFARLTATPGTAPPGLDVTFDGSGSSDDSAVALYFFEYGDGTDSGWQRSPVAKHAYPMQGDMLASLTVKDDDGTPSSNFATAAVAITTRGFRPAAIVDGVSPSPARAGDAVTLRGHGTAVEGARIAKHSWNSSIDGHLGDIADLVVTRLSEGSHTLIYKVQDDRGLWSEPATAELDVLPEEGRWTISYLSPDEGADVRHVTFTVAGVASYSVGPVEYVEARVDNEPWQRARGTETWTIDVDASALDDGYHTLRARAHSEGSDSPVAYLNITVDLQAKPPSQLGAVLAWVEGHWLATVVVVVATVTLVALAAVARRRSRRRARSRVRG
jgi:hypothetical protein